MTNYPEVEAFDRTMLGNKLLEVPYFLEQFNDSNHSVHTLEDQIDKLQKSNAGHLNSIC